MLRANRYDLEVHEMIRQNLFSDAWDGDDEQASDSASNLLATGRRQNGGNAVRTGSQRA